MLAICHFDGVLEWVTDVVVFSVTREWVPCFVREILCEETEDSWIGRLADPGLFSIPFWTERQHCASLGRVGRILKPHLIISNLKGELQL